MTSELINRPLYLNKLWKYKDNDRVKVLTGVRGAGKSSILKLFQQQLKDAGIKEGQILELNFELFKYHDWDAESFYNFIKSKTSALNEDERLYLFLDEIQNLENWENLVNNLRTELDIDIYVTGSNAYLMSSKSTTLFSDRTSSLQILPLSFSEFLNFHGYYPKKLDSKLLLNNWSLDETDVDITVLFNHYLKFGSFPELISNKFNDSLVVEGLEKFYDQIFLKDLIYARLNSNKRSVMEPKKLNSVLALMSNLSGELTPISTFVNELKNENNYRTVKNYIDAITSAFLFYPVSCLDYMRKSMLRSIRKYYAVDPGLNNFLSMFPESNLKRQFENIVFLELIRRDFQVNVERFSQTEIDFKARKGGQTWYIQVTEDIENSNTLQREIKPLKKVKEFGNKLIITGQPSVRKSYEDIRIISIYDFLLDQESIL